MAKGFTQTYGIDYLETFAPVAEINIIREIFGSEFQLALTPVGRKKCFLKWRLGR